MKKFFLLFVAMISFLFQPLMSKVENFKIHRAIGGLVDGFGASSDYEIGAMVEDLTENIDDNFTGQDWFSGEVDPFSETGSPSMKKAMLAELLSSQQLREVGALAGTDLGADPINAALESLLNGERGALTKGASTIKSIAARAANNATPANKAITTKKLNNLKKKVEKVGSVGLTASGNIPDAETALKTKAFQSTLAKKIISEEITGVTIYTITEGEINFGQMEGYTTFSVKDALVTLIKEHSWLFPRFTRIPLQGLCGNTGHLTLTTSNTNTSDMLCRRFNLQINGTIYQGNPNNVPYFNITYIDAITGNTITTKDWYIKYKNSENAFKFEMDMMFHDWTALNRTLIPGAAKVSLTNVVQFDFYGLSEGTNAQVILIGAEHNTEYGS